MRTLGPIVTLICLLALSSQGQEDLRFSDQAAGAARVKREQIAAELESLTNHPWAGRYHCSEVFDTYSMILAPHSGYVYEWRGCVGLYNRNFGDVAFTNGEIRLSFSFENRKKGFRHLAEAFTVIEWGPRRYLVPSDDIIGFCNEVNAGTQPNSGSFGFYLIRKGNEEKKVTGQPTVPTAFRNYLLVEPVEATILSVGKYTTRPSVCEWKFKDTPVILNVGRQSGLLEGMELHVYAPSNLIKSVTITEVGTEESHGVMVGIGEDDDGPKKGWRLSTREQWGLGNREHTTR